MHYKEFFLRTLMVGFKKTYLLLSVIFFLLSAFASSIFAGGNNPATTNYVDREILKLTTQINNLQIPTYTAGSGISIVNDVVSQNPSYAIGDFVQNAGVVFWLDETLQHGLMVAVVDQSTGAPICNDATCPKQYAGGTGVGSGWSNTASLLGAQIAKLTTPDNVVNFAPSLASNYTTTNGFGAWYLAATIELHILASQIDIVNETLSNISGATQITSGVYWSSVGLGEGSNQVYGVEIPTASTLAYDQNTNHYVRAIRRF